MKQAYRSQRFRPASLRMIERIDGILGEYRQQGFVLTVRQLYYQLVARDIIPNNERSYQNTIGLVTDARMAGMLDWSMIEDRTRSFVRRASWSSAANIVDACAEQFHMDMWETQHCRVYIVVEKEALVGVFDRVARAYDCPLLAARGYVSVSALRDFAERDLIPAINDNKTPTVLHFGDHDPSGIDMTRDIEARLHEFGVNEYDWELERLALNMDQVRQYRPPPNPAKVTDSRFKAYAAQYGNESWELDALSPRNLEELARAAIEQRINKEAWATREHEIKQAKLRIADAAERLRQLEE